MNSRHAPLQVPIGAGVNSITVRDQHILYLQRRVARVANRGEHTTKRDGLRKEKVDEFNQTTLEFLKRHAG